MYGPFMDMAYSMTSRTDSSEGLGNKSIEVVLSAGMSADPIKSSLRDVTLITFQRHSKLERGSCLSLVA